MKLWVDDERPAPDGTWKVRTDSISARYWLAIADQLGTPIEEVSLDHDLGYSDTFKRGGEVGKDGLYDTGFFVLDFMIEFRIWPQTLTIHTANPAARERMLRAAHAEAPSEVDIYWRTW